VANFNIANTYTVTFDTSPTNPTFSQNAGTVTFNLGGRTYTATAAAVGTDNLGLTARLTLINGDFATSGISIGAGAPDTGFLTISTNATMTVSGTTFLVGNNGNGTLTIQNGGQLTTSLGANNATIGSSATGFGAVTVTGANSKWTLAAGNAFIIGPSGIATLTVSNGGTVTAGSLTNIGNNAGSSGTVTVTGADSRLNINANLNIGNTLGGQGHFNVTSAGAATSLVTTLAGGDATVSGAGSTWSATGLTLGSGGLAGAIEINAGGTLNTTSAALGGGSVSSTGIISLSGPGSTWNNTGSITLGSAGAGTLNVGAGSQVVTAASLTVTTTGVLNLSGGTVDVGNNFNRTGAFNHTDGMLIVRGTYSHGAAPSALTINGNSSTALPTLHLIGNVPVSNVNAITVGSSRNGALILSDSRFIDVGAGSVNIGSAAGSNGTITLSNGAFIVTTGTTTVGGIGSTTGGTAVLNLNAGGTLSTGPLYNQYGGTINLNGGRLSLTSYVDWAGAFNWNAGHLSFLGAIAHDAAMLDRFLGGAHSLVAGQTLHSSGATTFNAPITVDGGTINCDSIVNNSAITINAGLVKPISGTFTNNSFGVVLIQGTGALTSGLTIINNGLFQLNGPTASVSGFSFSNSGTFTGSGNVQTSSFTNNALGSIQVTTGQKLTFIPGVSNAGTISFVGGEIVFNGVVTNAASTGIISGRDAILRFKAGLTNNGSIAFTAGQMDVYGDITNNVGGRITISGGGTATFYDDVTIAPGAANVQVSATGNFVSQAIFFGSYNGGISGTGAAFIEGDHRPGNSPGLVTFGGTLSYGDFANLQIELGGQTRGTQYDAINVASQLTLGGTLNVSLINSFIPAVGSTFNLFTAPAINGSFAATNLPASTPTVAGPLNFVWNSATLNTTGNLTLTRAFFEVQSGTYAQSFFGANVELIKTTSNTATLTNASTHSGPTTVQSGTLLIAHHGALGTGNLILLPNTTAQLAQNLAQPVKMPALTLPGTTNNWSALFDITNNKVIIDAPTNHAATLATLQNQITFGQSNPTGIKSSTLDANHVLVLTDNALANLNTFAGQPVTTDSILVFSALLGDANVDGTVNFSDFVILSQNFGNPGTWHKANFNSSATIDFNDFVILSQHFGQTSSFSNLTVTPEEFAYFQAASASFFAGNGIPEPTTLSLLALATIPLLTRRKK
jgi:T5SS/PEP-CTERM-associated repeat protein